MWSALATAGGVHLSFGGRHALVVRIALAMGWASAFVLVSVLPKRELSHPGGHPHTRVLAAGIAFTAVPLLFAAMRAAPRGAQASTDAPNIVLVTFDAMRADSLSLYGGVVPAPQFEALARDGVVFERAYSQSPATMASVPSMFSSLYPSELVFRGSTRSFPIPKTSPSLAEALQKRGYATYAVVANYVLSKPIGVLRGFSKKVLLYHRAQQCNVFSLVLPGAGAVVQSVVRRPQHECLFDSSQAVLRSCREIIGRPSRRPFFLWLHFMDPHGPYWPPAPDRAPFDVEAHRWPGDPAALPVSKTDYGTNLIPRYQAIPGHADPADYRTRYDGEIHAVDGYLAAVVDLLRRHGIWEHAVVILTADHGESLGEHGYFFQHGQSAAHVLTHVPLALRAPGRVPVGRRIAATVSLVDVLPTVLDLLAIPLPPDVEGRTLLPVIAGDESDRDAWTDAPEEVGLRRGRLLYRMATSTTPAASLFDVVADPAEEHDLAAERPAELASLGAQTTAWLTAQRARGMQQARAAAALLLQRARDASGATPQPSSRGRENALRALGYVQ